MRPPILIRYSFLFIVALFAASCGGAEEDSPPATPVVVDSIPSPTSEPASPTPLSEAVYGLAQVEAIEILILESFPVQVNVLVSGLLPNGCTIIDEAIVQEEGNVFNVALTTVREPGQPCTEAEEPFEERIPLDVLGLDAGTYQVNVNGTESTFTLDIDNRIQEEAPPPTPVVEATPEVTPVAESSSISGLVWHDLCVEPAPGEGLDQPEADPRCINDSGDLRADGRLDDEPGIEGLQILLGKGACPGEENAIEFTGADGSYLFESLAPGTYCVSIDEISEENRGVLLAGEWTSPGIAVAQVEVDLDPGDNPDDINFGWDYRFLPIDSEDPTACTNSFGFLEDLNYPDDTAVPPEAEFTKQWRLFNNGTCPWTNEYSIVFVGGDFSPGEEAIPLNRNIVPGQALTVAVDIIAPETPGTYRLNWQIADANGEPFGIDAVIEDAFFVQFIVDENAAPVGEVAPNSATIGGVVWEDFCLGDDPGSGCIEFPEESGNFIGDGTFSAAEEPLSDITISLAAIACPSDGTLPPEESVIATTITDAQGLYRFEDLSDGTYCIFMDALSEENVNFLIPGNWTYPATGVGRYTFFLDPGEQALDLDFGWDYVD